MALPAHTHRAHRATCCPLAAPITAKAFAVPAAACAARLSPSLFFPQASTLIFIAPAQAGYGDKWPS